MDEEQVFEKVPSLLFGLYYMYIQPVAHVAYKSIPLVIICMKLSFINHRILCNFRISKFGKFEKSKKLRQSQDFFLQK